MMQTKGNGCSTTVFRRLGSSVCQRFADHKPCAIQTDWVDCTLGTVSIAVGVICGFSELGIGMCLIDTVSTWNDFTLQNCSSCAVNGQLRIKMPMKQFCSPSHGTMTNSAAKHLDFRYKQWPIVSVSDQCTHRSLADKDPGSRDLGVCCGL